MDDPGLQGGGDGGPPAAAAPQLQQNAGEQPAAGAPPVTLETILAAVNQQGPVILQLQAQVQQLSSGKRAAEVAAEELQEEVRRLKRQLASQDAGNGAATGDRGGQGSARGAEGLVGGNSPAGAASPSVTGRGAAQTSPATPLFFFRGGAALGHGYNAPHAANGAGPSGTGTGTGMPAVNAPAPPGTHDRVNIPIRNATGTLLNTTAPAATELDTHRATIEASRQQEAATAVTINTLQTDLGAAHSDLDQMRRNREAFAAEAAELAERSTALHARSLAGTAQPMQGVETTAGQQQAPVAAAQAAAAAVVPSAAAAGPSSAGAGPSSAMEAGPGPSSRQQLDELTLTGKEFQALANILHAIALLPQFPDERVVITFVEQASRQWGLARAIPIRESTFLTQLIMHKLHSDMQTQAAAHTTVTAFLSWVRTYFGVTGVALRDDAIKLLLNGNMKQHELETVIAYHSRYMHTLRVAETATQDSLFTLRMFHKGLLPAVKGMCLTDPTGTGWTDIAQLVAYANGKQLAARAVDAQHKKRAFNQPHYHRQANKQGFRNPRMHNQGGEGRGNGSQGNGNSQGLANVQVGANAGFRPVSGRGGRGGSAQHTSTSGRGTGMGGRGMGSGGKGNNSRPFPGDAPGAVPPDGRTGLQWKQCWERGLCTNCLQLPNWPDQPHYDHAHSRQPGRPGWNCTRSRATWVDLPALPPKQPQQRH